MKKMLNIGFALVISLLYLSSSAFALSLNYSSAGDAVVKFTGTGDKLEFIDATSGPSLGYDFQIGSVTGGSDPDTVGLLGNIDIATSFVIGAITTVASYQEAPVTGTGTLSILDEGSILFSGDLDWVKIYTLSTTGGINAGGVVNLSGISYSGLNTDLLAFSSTGIVNATFNFVPAKSLTALTTDGTTNSTTYSGSITNPVPESSTLLLMGAGLLGIAVLGRKRMVKG